jgi:multiple sugar transport system permease protein
MASRRMCSVLRIVVCLVIAVFILTPVVLLVASSLKPSDQIMKLGLFNSPLSIESYIAVLKEDTFFRYMKNSFIVAGTVTFLALLFHAMAGYALARLNFIGKNAVFSWILSTMMVPFSVLMIPLFVIVKVFGLLNTLGGVILPSIPHAYGIFLFRQLQSMGLHI